MNISRILIPVDFSPLSRLALSYALAIARKFRARLTLLHVVESGTALKDAYPDTEAKLVREHIQQARRMLPALLSSRDQVRPDIRMVVRRGEIADTIRSVTKQERADLLVMGIHGRSLITRALIGSVAEKMLQDAAIPVLTVGHVDRFPSFRKILLATDLSDGARNAASFSADLARITHAQLVVTHVTDVELEGGAEAAVYLENNRIKEARAQLSALLAEANSQGAEIDVRSAQGSVAETILKSAREHAADLLVLAIRREGKPLIESAVPVIHKAHIPVLSIPVGAEEGSRKSRAA